MTAQVDHTKVASKPHWEGVPTTTGWRGSSHEKAIHDIHPKQFVTVVKTAPVKQLANELYARLRSPPPRGRQIDIFHENYMALPLWRPQ